VADQYGSNVGVVQRKSGEPTSSEMDSLENYFIVSGLSYSTIQIITVWLEFPRAEVVDEWRRKFCTGQKSNEPQARTCTRYIDVYNQQLVHGGF